MAITSFPNDAVCYVLADIPGQGEFQGSGVIIGPHTILTAAHLLWNADAATAADKVSIYPGFTPDTTAYNPAGALPGLQSIHYIKVVDNGDGLSSSATQSDFAVINTSTDLSRFGQFALDPSFSAGDVIATGYPASNGGAQAGTEGVVSKSAGFSDIDSSKLSLSPGYSGGPLWDKVERNGSLVPAVVGTVSTNLDAMKLTKAKVALIRHWIASDSSLYFGGSSAPRGIIPQIDGTVSSTVDAAAVSRPGNSSGLTAAVPPAFAYSDAAGQGRASGEASTLPTMDGAYSELVNILHATRSGSGDVTSAAPVDTGTAATIAAPLRVFHQGQGFGIDM